MRTPCAAFALVLSCAAAHATCLASWYGSESGKRTANGERFDPRGLTAASRTLAFGTVLRVTAGNRSVIVRINDRGPSARTGRCLDLSEGAARVLGILQWGTAHVSIEKVR
jgi:rare lipoprotein A